MNAISTFLDCLLFTVVCIAAWVILPLLIAAGCLVLLTYAMIAELVSPRSDADSGADQQLAARKAANRLVGTR